MPRAPLVIPYGSGLSVTLEPAQPLRLSTMTWDFPERPDLIALAERDGRLDFLCDHLKSLCGLWDKAPRAFLDAYFRDIRECIRRNRRDLEALAVAHGRLFQPEDWAYSALCPLPQSRLPAVPDAVVDFAFWNGAELETVFVLGPASQNRTQREGRTRLRDRGVHVTEIPGAELQHAAAGDLIARLPAALSKFWEGVSLPSSPFRIGALDEILPA
ncbi:MAG TPA: hypothetical protein VJN67_18385 [Stellaceae bacterium]|nr:hypothetical protein [Stellaceae bacterium]